MPEQNSPQEGAELEQLKRQYAESSTEGKRLAARVRQLEDENRQLALRAQPMQSEPSADADAQALEEAGIDTGALTRFLNRGVAQGLTPLFTAAQAQGQIPTELQPKANALLASDSEVSETYQALLSTGKSAAAAKYLSSQVRLHDAEAGMVSEGEAAREQRENARRDAEIVSGTGSRSGTAETVQNEEHEQAKRKALLERAQAMGGFDKRLASDFLKGKITVIERLDQPPRVI